jgi:hypothetical protein
MKPNISAITLGVADLACSRTFCCEGLGWKASSTASGLTTAAAEVLGQFSRQC